MRLLKVFKPKNLGITLLVLLLLLFFFLLAISFFSLFGHFCMFSYFAHCIYSAIQLSSCKCVLNKLSCHSVVILQTDFQPCTKLISQ